jgi:hypothetical protein
MPLLEPFLGPAPEERQARARTLSLLPYVVGGLTFVAAGLLNPHGVYLVLISVVAASLPGTPGCGPGARRSARRIRRWAFPAAGPG